MRSSMHTGRGEIASLNENESGKFVKILGTTMAPQPSGSLGCSRCPLEQCHISNTDCEIYLRVADVQQSQCGWDPDQG